MCVTADEIGAFTFRKLIERSADDARAVAKADCLAGHEREFQQSLTDLLFQGHADRRSEAASRAIGAQADAVAKRCKNILSFEGKLKRCKIRGYDVFTRSNFHSGLEGGSTFAKRKSLDSSWKSLSAAEQAAYNAVAEAETKNWHSMTMRTSLNLFPGNSARRMARNARL